MTDSMIHEPSFENGRGFGVFLLEAKRKEEIKLTITHDFEKRKDIDLYSDNRIRVLVIGHPYTEAPAGWLSSSRIAELYSVSGSSLLSGVHGYFNMIIEDAIKKCTLIATGRIGGYGIFSIRVKDSLFFSDSVETLAKQANSLTIESSALVEFLELGLLIGKKTMFKEIERIRPSRIVEISEKGVHLREYWNPLKDGGSESWDSASFADEFSSHVRNGFEISKRAALSMTAGLDSRAILSCCRPAEEDLRCFTIGNRMNEDVRIAGWASKKAGYSHTCYPVNKETVKNSLYNLEELMRMCNGMRNCLHFISFAAPAYSNESKKCDFLIAGNGGAMFKAYFALPERGNVHDRSTGEAALETLSFGKQFSYGLFRRGILGLQPSDILADSIMEELEAGGSEDALKASLMLDLNSRVVSFTALGPSLCGRYMKVWEPWLHTRFLEIAFNVPLEEKQNHNIHKSIIIANNEALSTIPANRKTIYGNNRGMRHRSCYTAFKLGMSLIDLINKANRQRRGWELISTNYVRDYQKLIAENFYTILSEFIEELENSAIGSFLDMAVVRLRMEEMRRGNYFAGIVMTNLLCAYIWVMAIGKQTMLKSE